MSESTVVVWDRLVRLLHGALVLALAVSWLGTFVLPGVHQPAGYLALALVGVRLAWGFSGGRYARFSQFVRGPRLTWAYALDVLRRCEPRHIGHNPLGAWMILALLGGVAALALTGWLYTTDRFWGDEQVEAVHRWLAWALLALALLHLAGVIYTGWRQRESLPLAMLTGRKRGPDRDDAGARTPLSKR
jgi:cytochrome b